MNNPDSDGDGLEDGDEVKLHGTNPLLLDTDGDGVSDDTELEMNTDPTDPNSFTGTSPVPGLALPAIGLLALSLLTLTLRRLRPAA